VVAATGDPVPATTSRQEVIARVDRATLGPNGEVVLFIDSSGRQFAEQHVLDLRGDQTLLQSARTWGPLLGSLQDASVEGTTVRSRDEATFPFHASDYLLIAAQGTLSPDDPEETEVLLRRSPTGALEVVAYGDTAMQSSPLASGFVALDARVNANGTVLVSDDEGWKIAGDSPQLVLDFTAPVPDDPTSHFLRTDAWLLDDDTVVICCHKDAPYRWVDGTLANAAATPNETNNNALRDFITVHRSGYAAYGDTYVNANANGVLTEALYTGRIGTPATRISDAHIMGGCPAGGDLSPQILAMDGSGRATFIDPTCGIGQFGPSGAIEWVVLRGDTDAEGAELMGFDTFGVAVSDDGGTVMFKATARDPVAGALSGVWIVPSVGGDAEQVAYVGQRLERAVGDVRTIASVSFGHGAVNNLGQGVVQVGFVDAETDVRAPSAVLVANQQPILENLADLEVELEQVRSNANYAGIQVTLTNHGPATVYDLAFTLKVPDSLTLIQIEDTPDECAFADGLVTCEDATADPDGLLSTGDSRTFELNFNDQSTGTATVEVRGNISSSVPDPDMSNNTHLIVLDKPALDLSVEESVRNGGVLLTFFVANRGTTTLRDITLRLGIFNSINSENIELDDSRCEFTDITFHTCRIDELLAGEETSVEVFVTQGDFTYSASATSATGDEDAVSGEVHVDDPTTIDERTGGNQPKQGNGGCATTGPPGHVSLLALLAVLGVLLRRRW